MGTDKADMEMRVGVSQLDYLLGLLDPFCVQRAVLLGPKSAPERQVEEGVARIRDVESCAGPMAGVIAALKAGEGKAVLVLACDLPLLDAGALLQIVNRRDQDKFATVFVGGDGNPEPLCCLYESRCLRFLEALAGDQKLSLRRFLNEVEIERVLPASGEMLANVNDASELEKVRLRLRPE